MVKMKFTQDHLRLAKDRPYSVLKSVGHIHNIMLENGFYLDSTDPGVYVHEGPEDLFYLLPRVTKGLEAWEGLIDYLKYWVCEENGSFYNLLKSYKESHAAYDEAVKASVC